MAVERMKLRLDKYLADMGLGTRSQIKKDISKGQVLVNGTVSKDAGTRIDTEKDQVSYLGQAVTYAEYEYYMLNKPAGVVSATEDRHDRTVLDLIDTKQRKDLSRSEDWTKIPRGFCSSRMMVRWLTGFFLLRATSTKFTLPGLRERLPQKMCFFFRKV